MPVLLEPVEKRGRQRRRGSGSEREETKTEARRDGWLLDGAIKNRKQTNKESKEREK